jgi:hypothetical protein
MMTVFKASFMGAFFIPAIVNDLSFNETAPGLLLTFTS